MEPFTLISEGESHAVRATSEGGTIRIPADDVERALGWRLEDGVLCRDDVCVPVTDAAALATDEGIDLAALCTLLGRPLALAADEGAAALGAPADRGLLSGTEAPDFELPDLAGRRHRLSAYRGKKVLLVAYASW